jgi:hypothetical protein
METQRIFVDKITAEFDAYIDGLREKSADEIISAAYRKVCYDEIAGAFVNADYTERDYSVLNSQDNLLSSIYSAWLDSDTADFEQMQNVIDDYIERETGHKIEHYIQLKGEPEWYNSNFSTETESPSGSAPATAVIKPSGFIEKGLQAGLAKVKAYDEKHPKTTNTKKKEAEIN